MRRSRMLLGASTAGTALLAYHQKIRPRMNRWGATEEEARGSLPGDEFRPDPTFECTRAITIDAPPEEVWPWIAQLGDERAGFYSYDWVERLLLSGHYVEGRSARRIHPELQDLCVGDEIAFASVNRVPVTALEPDHHLVIGTSYAFVLEPLEDERTRLLVRTRGKWIQEVFHRVPVLRQVGAIIDYVIGEPLHFAMERKMLLGIAERAEIRGSRELAMPVAS